MIFEFRNHALEIIVNGFGNLVIVLFTSLTVYGILLELCA
jgi:hypothetical protein